MNTSYKSRSRGKSPGWAAFDLKQRQKQGLLHHQLDSNDPFPPLPTNALRPCENLPANNVFSSTSFSSADFTSLTDNVNVNKLKGVNDSGLVESKNPDFAFFSSWVDKSLIQDVMAAANNDIEKATTLLKEMVSTDSSEQNGTTNCDGFHQSNEGEDESAFLKKTSDLAADIADLSSVLEDAFRGNHKELEDACAASEQRLSDDAVANLQLILEHLRSLPVEPEWEEHDVYLSQRRNALRMMRLASKHSRAATNAFMRGDHFSAHQLSLKARNEWLDAEGLNAKAAKEILSIRNSEKNPWKLDLHGLHTVEAVQALQERLEKIEIQLNQLVSPSRANTKIETVHSSLEPLSGMGVENLDKQQTEFRQRSASLQVITGVGNHSRGQATLPTAVRSFLTENRYHFDEVKPGVIAVCPKFRHR